MALRRLITDVSKHRSELGQVKYLFVRTYTVNKFGGAGGNSAQRRFQSNYAGNFTHRIRDADEASEAAHLRELVRQNVPEVVIRLFESQPSLNSNWAALKEYVKALVKVDRLDDPKLGVTNSAREEESIGSFSALKNVGKSTKDGILGTARAPIHMVAAEGGFFKKLLWRMIHTIALGFLLISGVGALIEDKRNQ